MFPSSALQSDALKYRVAQIKPELLQSNQNESTEKHVFNEQTSPNKSRNFCLKHFCISRDTTK